MSCKLALKLSFIATLMAGSLVTPVMAQELPDGLKFKRLNNKKTSIVLKKCELVEGIKNFEILKKGKRIRPPARRGKKPFIFPERYRFFSCHQSDEGVSLYVKKTAAGDVSKFDFEEEDFPNGKNGGGSKDPQPGQGLSSVCPKGVRGVGFGILYKPHADASDARRGKPVVLLQGGNKTNSSAMNVFAANGTQVCRFTFKSSSIPGINGGSHHYFSGWSGGCGRTGNQIASAARSAAGGNSSIYLQWKGGQCLGPINPASRVGGIG